MIKQVPFFKLLIPFTGGIITVLSIGFTISQLNSVVILLSLFVLLIITFSFRYSWKFRWAFGAMASVFLFGFGFFLTLLNQQQSALVDGSEYNAIVKIIDVPEVRLSSTRVHAQVSAIREGSDWKALEEDVLLYFSASDSAAQLIRFGDLMALQTVFASPPAARNPNQFNYAKYLARKGVYRTAFVNADSWIKVGSKKHWLLSTSFTLRSKMLTLFRAVGMDGENLAVLSALTMGYKSLLDQETRRVFSASGAMHILAVSGLHVGILFSTLSAFLFFLGRVKHGKFFKAIILICFLWFFAVFTGLSPSVLRASLMFTLVIIGTSFSYKTNIYNTLSASAFVILVANPLLITEVGFQLSYIAVVSIVFFYPYIYKLVFIKNKWIDKIWVLISVSLAAQLGTFVLGLFYFNQFPNYFLLTNLYAIPLAFIVLYLTIGLVSLSFVPVIASALGAILNGALSLLNNLIRFTEGLPFSTSTGIYLSQTQTIVLILAILMFALLINYRKLVFGYAMLGLFVLFFAERAYRFADDNNQKELVVFADSKKSIVGFRHGHNVMLCSADTALNLVANNFSYTLNGYLNRLGVSQNLPINPMLRPDTMVGSENSLVNTHKNKLGCWVQFNGKSILVPNDNSRYVFRSASQFPVDILLISRNSSNSTFQLLDIVSPSLVIADETVPVWHLDSLRNELSRREVPLYIVKESGAFVL